jgi:hypothetical protein
MEESQRNIYLLVKRWEIKSDTITIYSKMFFDLQWFLLVI